MLWLDEYERRARLAPGLLTLFPLAVVLVAFGFRELPLGVYVMTSVALIGGPVVVANLVRRRGLKTEKRLVVQWGGWPTTKKLRLREAPASQVQRDIWRDAVASVSGISLPNLRTERRSGVKADQAIEAAVGAVRGLTRDRQRFELLFSENRAYGYERNLYGMRGLGRLSSFVAILSLAAYPVWAWFARGSLDGTATHFFGMTVTFVVFVFWYVFPSVSKVADAADRYADQLLQAAVTLERDPPPTV